MVRTVLGKFFSVPSKKIYFMKTFLVPLKKIAKTETWSWTLRCWNVIYFFVSVYFSEKHIHLNILVRFRFYPAFHFEFIILSWDNKLQEAHDGSVRVRVKARVYYSYCQILTSASPPSGCFQWKSKEGGRQVQKKTLSFRSNAFNTDFILLTTKTLRPTFTISCTPLKCVETTKCA